MESQRKYIWEQFNDDDEEEEVVVVEEDNENQTKERIASNLNETSLDDKSAISSIGFESLNYSKESVSLHNNLRNFDLKFSRENRISQNDSMENDTIMSNISFKIDKMKQQRNAQLNNLKKLKEEFVRIQSAVGRRQSKLKSKYEEKLFDISREHESTQDKDKKFMLKLEGDVEKLEQQVLTLEKTSRQFDEEREVRLLESQTSADRKFKQARKQWELEESKVMSKVLEKKQENLKNQASSSWGPKMEQFVKQKKLEVQKRKEDLSLDLEKRKSDMEAEFRHKTEVFHRRAQQDGGKHSQLDKLAQQHKRRKEELFQQTDSERTRLAHKLQSEKRAAEDELHSALQWERESNMEAKKNITEQESKRTEALLEENQRQIEVINEKFQREIQSLTEILSGLERKSDEKLHLIREKIKKERFAEMKDSLNKKFYRQTQEIMSKIREDSETRKAELKRSLSHQLDELRQSLGSSSERLHDAVQRQKSKLDALLKEVQDLELENDSVASRVRSQDLLEGNKQLRHRLDVLRADLASVEKEWDRLAFPDITSDSHNAVGFKEKSFSDCLEAKRTRLEQEVSDKEKQIVELKTQLRSVEKQGNDRLEHDAADIKAELESISSKIERLMNSRNQRVLLLTQKVNGLEKSVLLKSEHLEQLRKKLLESSDGI